MTLKVISENLFIAASYGAWGIFIWVAWTDRLPKNDPMLLFVYNITVLFLTAYLLVSAIEFIVWLAQRAGLAGAVVFRKPCGDGHLMRSCRRDCGHGVAQIVAGRACVMLGKEGRDRR